MTSSGLLLVVLSLLAQQKPGKVKNIGDGSVIVERKGLRDGLCFSPDGKLLAAMEYETSDVLVYDAKSFQLVHTLRGIPAPDQNKPEAAIRNHFIEFSPDSKLLVCALAAEQFKPIIVWEAATGRVVGNLARPERQTDTVGFSPTGKELLVAGFEKEDRVLRVWSTELVNGQMNVEPTRSWKPEFVPKDIVLDPTGSKIYLDASERGYVVADAVSGAVLDTVEEKAKEGKIVYTANGFSLSPNGKLFAVATGRADRAGGAAVGVLRVWDVEKKKLLLEALQPELGHQVAFSPDGKMVATVSDSLFLYELAGGRLLRKAGSGLGANLAFTPDSAWVAVKEQRGLIAYRTRKP